MFAALLLAAMLHPQQPTTFQCDIRDASSPALRSSSGINVQLSVHADDDHGKNTHLCETDYSISVWTPGQLPHPPDQIMGVEGEWHRPVTFQLFGFSQDHQRVFGIFSEGGKYASVDLFSYDITSRKSISAALDKSFARRLPSSCIPSLTVIGTSDDGLVVLTSSDPDHCSAKRWTLRLGTGAHDQDINYAPHLLPLNATITPLDPGTH